MIGSVDGHNLLAEHATNTHQKVQAQVYFLREANSGGCSTHVGSMYAYKACCMCWAGLRRFRSASAAGKAEISGSSGRLSRASAMPIACVRFPALRAGNRTQVKWRVPLKELELACAKERLGAALHGQFPINVFKMGFDGAHRNN